MTNWMAVWNHGADLYEFSMSLVGGDVATCDQYVVVVTSGIRWVRHRIESTVSDFAKKNKQNICQPFVFG